MTFAEFVAAQTTGITDARTQVKDSTLIVIGKNSEGVPVEKQVTLPEPLIELPIPNWAQVTEAGDNWWADVTSKRMFVSEARSAFLAYQEQVQTMLDALKPADKLVIYNASGHPIAQEDVEIVGTSTVGNVDFAKPADVAELAKKIATEAAPHIRAGAAVALPGSSTLASQVLAVLHAILGHFPRQAWSAKEGDKFVWKIEQQVDLQELRIATRGEGNRI